MKNFLFLLSLLPFLACSQEEVMTCTPVECYKVEHQTRVCPYQFDGSIPLKDDIGDIGEGFFIRVTADTTFQNFINDSCEQAKWEKIFENANQRSVQDIRTHQGELKAAIHAKWCSYLFCLEINQ